jgi:hypothetical protein
MHVLANYLLEEKEKEKKTSWGGDIMSRGTREPQAPTEYVITYLKGNDRDPKIENMVHTYCFLQ